MENLIEIAREALKKSYSPYSKFKVGAAVLTANNKIYSGCNVENASYGATICAERTAVLKAVSDGEKTITKIAVVTDNAIMPYPCGMCLQVLAEFASPETQVIVASNSKTEVMPLKNFLPKSFSLKE